MDKDKFAICDECGSEFLKSNSSMIGLCPECAHVLYGYPNCAHVFKNGRCIYCYWDGSQSEYIEQLKRNDGIAGVKSWGEGIYTMKNIFEIVKKYIDKLDYMCLLENGAPDDEFDSESMMIANQISFESTKEEISNIIANVFKKSFGNNIKTEFFEKIALEIEEELNLMR